jgi:2-polyprenyl-6-methoxyphenol hydroxylase-like FAD-dependent oxidoreductase
MNLPRGVALSRRALDAALVEQSIAAGCVVYERTVGRVVRAAPDAVEIETTSQGNTRTLHAKLAIVADGLAGSALTGHTCFTRQTKTNSKRGYGAHVPAHLHDHPTGRITMHCGSRGYLGAVVLEDGSLDLAAAIDPGFVKRSGGIAAAVADIIDQASTGLPVRTDLDALAWKATPPLTGSRPQRWSAALPGVLLLGDSAGYVEPFTGEGMAWALRGASAIMPIAERVLAQGWSGDAGTAWDRAYRRQVAKRQARCRVVAGMLRRPQLTAAVVALLSKLPEISRRPIDAVLAPGGLGAATGANERRALWR